MEESYRETVGQSQMKVMLVRTGNGVSKGKLEKVFLSLGFNWAPQKLLKVNLLVKQINGYAEAGKMLPSADRP